jgi:hypothetical protein
MELIMTKEEEIYNNVSQGSCHQCDFGVPKPKNGASDEPLLVFECKIKDIKKCPIVIHDMSL